MKTRPFLLSCITLLLTTAQAASADERDDWQHYGGGPGGSHYSSLTQINRENVGDLQLAWPSFIFNARPLNHDNPIQTLQHTLAHQRIGLANGLQHTTDR